MISNNYIVILLVLLSVAAFAVALVSGLSIIQRRQLIARASAEGQRPTVSAVLIEEKSGPVEQLTEWMQRVGNRSAPTGELQDKLVMAGYDQPGAPAVYYVLRTASAVLFPVVTVVVLPRSNFTLWVLMIATASFIGLILPAALLDRSVRLRQERIRRSVPDALDLLVVCVEAGVSLDAAILRVSKEIRLAHTELAHELGVVNRLTNAGLTREQALRGLWQRTGVEDLRTLVSSLIQSEKWGTSIATVLRVAAQTLRRKRRQHAEKKAKQAPLKMTFPLLFFILPALFSVIFGPAIATVVREFGKI